MPDDFRFTVNGQPLSAQRVEAGNEGHGDHHDANDGDAGHRHGGEERRGRPGDWARYSWSKPSKASSSSPKGDVEKRGIKLVKDGVPA